MSNSRTIVVSANYVIGNKSLDKNAQQCPGRDGVWVNGVIIEQEMKSCRLNTKNHQVQSIKPMKRQEREKTTGKHLIINRTLRGLIHPIRIICLSSVCHIHVLRVSVCVRIIVLLVMIMLRIMHHHTHC